MKKLLLKFEYKFFIGYLLIGCLWILFSDKILNAFISDKDYLTTIQTYKGWFYVLITGWFFYYLLKKHLIKIRDAELKARESEQLKSAFLQNMSHEIRTPMNGIIGFAALLRNSNITKEQRDRYLNILTQSSDQLLHVVNDVLDLSLIETGSIILERDVVDVNAVLDEFYDVYSVSLKEGINLQLNKGVKEGLKIITDDVKFRQILNNLLSNAQKFTEKGNVEFGYELNDFQLLFYVKDSGIGIDPEMKEKIFDRFLRAKIETTKTIGGAGLGLAICRGNLDVMKGKIWVEPNHMNGSSFYFTIPFEKAEEIKGLSEKVEKPCVMPDKNCILVAEDEDTNFYYLLTILENAGLEIIRACNGVEAVDLFKKNPKISFILMDIKMPLMSGYEATGKIREFNKNVPIIAQTAFAMSDERTKAIEAGCTDYIAKPFKKTDILTLIENFQNLN
ncbi:hybrid sensor histidine kinase/response regulator [Marinifilum sp. RC60d5]|uniref:hybrid sensor histidine kinase/response regulator n=1 Tax=Marinifilum sp. RC60d5 TaxID=3458414 RepID=UPI004036380A